MTALRGTCLLAAALVVAISGSSAAAAVASPPDEPGPVRLYASPDPAPGADCTEARPCSLAQVQAAERQYAAGDVIVYLRGGTYRLAQPLRFDARDSGAVWRNYPDESPVLSGGVPITGWTRGADGVWSAGAQGLNFVQLYGTGQRFTRARTPNAGTFVKAQTYTLAGTDTRQVKVSDDALPDWNLGQLNRVQVILQDTWRQWRFRIASTSADQNGNRWVVTRTPGGATRAAGGTLPVASDNRPNGDVSPTFFENAREFLDQPGEWYLDTAADRVYFKPPSGADPNALGVTAPVTEQLVDVDGAASLQFYGLQFAHTTWMLPDQQGNLQRQGGFHVEQEPAGQAGGFPVWYVNPGAVRVQNSSGISFERNVFRFLGANGIVFGAATHDDRIVGNRFTQIADTGIFIGDAQDPTAPLDQQNRDETVANNYFAGMGRDYVTDGAIVATFPNGLTVAHNLTRDVHNIAINVGSIDNIGANVEVAMRNVQIVDNRIDGACNIAIDCGAIHTKNDFYYDDTVARSSIQRNYITNVTRNPFQSNKQRLTAIYPDNFSNNLLIARNEWDHVDHGIQLNTNGGNNTITDNDTGDQAVIDGAGLEPAYADLPTLDPDTTSIGGSGGPGAASEAQLLISSPQVMRPLGDGLVTLTLSNDGSTPLRDLRVRVAAYNQAGLAPLSGHLVGLADRLHRAVPADTTIQWRFDVPLDAVPGRYGLLAQVGYQTSDGRLGQADASATTWVPAAVTTSLDPASLLLTSGQAGQLGLRASSNIDVPITLTYRTSVDAGVQVEPSTGQVDLPAGASTEIPLTVTGTDPGQSTVTLTLTANGSVDVGKSTATVNVVHPSLAAAFDNVGITEDADPSPGAWGAHHRSYSAQALAAAGVAPGASVTFDGIDFTWPDVPAGTPDNVQANGQPIALAGTGTRLGFLGASDGQAFEGAGTVHYTDGTTGTFTLHFPHWWFPIGRPAVNMPYLNDADTGRIDQHVYLYVASAPIDAGKTVAAIELPTISAPPAHGMHVFAMALGS